MSGSRPNADPRLVSSPPPSEAPLARIGELRDILRKLRSPDGCPWDREQTLESLRPALLEECHEVLDAIDRGNFSNLQEELGDLLLLVFFFIQIAEESGDFVLEDVGRTICEKLIRRHPHVFGDATSADSKEVLRQWEQIKRAEKGNAASVMDGITAGLPALMKAQSVQKKAARVGFDWEEIGGVFEKVEEEMRELREAQASGSRAAIEEEFGDLLFTMVNLSRKLEVDAEISLHRATDKFLRRFQTVERLCAERNTPIEDTPMEELDRLWEAQKTEASPAR